MRSILILLNSVSSNIFEAIFIPFFFAPALARSRYYLTHSVRVYLFQYP